MLSRCGRCTGSGTDDNKRDANGNVILESCAVCGGDGWVETDRIDITTITDKLELFTNLSPTCKVGSCMNNTEYLALSDAAKDGVKIVLACGFVDMRDGQWARTTLFSIFGVNSLTRSSLIAMFG
jgi:hypothetical protein